jgi:acyl carrier protein
MAQVLERKGSEKQVAPASRLSEDLELDSLDLAEISVALEDNLGRDPWSDGIVPATVAEVLAYYES